MHEQLSAIWPQLAQHGLFELVLVDDGSPTTRICVSLAPLPIGIM